MRGDSSAAETGRTGLRKTTELPEEIRNLLAHGKEFGYPSTELENLDGDKVIAIHWQPGEKENSLVRTILDYVTEDEMQLIISGTERARFMIRRVS